MAAGPGVDVSGWLQEQLARASPDLLRSMVTTFAEALMGTSAALPAASESEVHHTVSSPGGGAETSDLNAILAPSAGIQTRH
jgi:hypothetical protein